jgi:tRNA(Ile2) C34 agmatinyltransferase TiaS
MDRAREVAREILSAEEPEVDRFLVSGAVVTRKGNHYRIESGEEDLESVERLHRRLAGACDCGAPLSSRGEVERCRQCGREFHQH